MIGQFVDFLFYFHNNTLKPRLRAFGKGLAQQARQFMAKTGQFLYHVIDGFIPGQHPEGFSE
jgi:hypothetical protein